MTSGMLFVINFWKGRRKDKESPGPEEVKEYLEANNARARISDVDFFKLVALPYNADQNEWMATHTISFFNHVNLVYGVVSEFCTPESCPNMSGPDNVNFLWTDDKGKKFKYSAPQYIDNVMFIIQQLINDETVFPTKFGHTFPSDMESTVRKIHRYLFHVLAHLYHAHYNMLHSFGLHGHLNTLFTHFMVFIDKFDLVQDKESEVLLKLFSLLLKNLADPAQNPTLREGLGLPAEDKTDSPPKDSESTDNPSDPNFPDGALCNVSPCVLDDSTPHIMSMPTTAIDSSSHSGENLSNGGSALHSLCDSEAAPFPHLVSEERVVDTEPSPRTEPTAPPSEWLANLQVSAT